MRTQKLLGSKIHSTYIQRLQLWYKITVRPINHRSLQKPGLQVPSPKHVTLLQENLTQPFHQHPLDQYSRSQNSCTSSQAPFPNFFHKMTHTFLDSTADKETHTPKLGKVKFFSSLQNTLIYISTKPHKQSQILSFQHENNHKPFSLPTSHIPKRLSKQASEDSTVNWLALKPLPLLLTRSLNERMSGPAVR
ncbi:UNVERIFIED_CONTAM: hypothetical protein K2H54_039384 [Gekko kuhli]